MSQLQRIVRLFQCEVREAGLSRADQRGTLIKVISDFKRREFNDALRLDLATVDEVAGSLADSFLWEVNRRLGADAATAWQSRRSAPFIAKVAGEIRRLL